MVNAPRKSPIRCADCGGRLPPKRRKFCSDVCSNRFHQTMHRKREKAKKYDLDPPVAKENRSTNMKGRTVAPTRGMVYERLVEQGLMRRLDTGEVEQATAAMLVGATQGAVSKAFQTWVADERLRIEGQGWRPDNAPPCLCGDHLDELIAHFTKFRTKYFIEPESGGPYLMAEFHKNWIRSILETKIFGLKQMILSPPRHGKRLADDTPVLTSQGWRTHGDLRIGDYVYAPDGTQTEVLHVTAPGDIDWRITFSDGEVIDAHSDHRWWVYDRAQKRYHMVDTKEMVDGGLHNGTLRNGGPRNRYLLDYCEPLQAPAADLPLDPYFLGVWLGDGKADGASICGAPDDLAEILVELKSRGCEPSWSTTHAITGVDYVGFKGVPLRALGLKNNKHIPDVYFTGSEEQRRDLLRGLVDTDGSVETADKSHGRVRFVTCSRRLANDVSRLVSTLGYRPSTTMQEPHLSTSGIQGHLDVYTVQWTPHDGAQQAYLARKDIRNYTIRRRRSVVSIERLEEPKTGRCISVAHPSHCYLAGESLTPTHNTELLAHFCIWMICCVDPNIRILMVGGNQDIAAITVGMVRSYLTENEDILNDWCPPDKTFRPAYKTGGKWTDTSFTVATRTRVNKSPTMVAVGRGGTLLSRDADIIICDDIEDDGSTTTQSGREGTRRWWATQVMSRKVAKTGVFVIGSRQHPDDLYSYILEDDRWKIIVEQMHQIDCLAEEEDYDAHVDCMLFPVVRDYRYMRDDLLADPLIAATFSMVYLNQPQESGLSTFPIAVIEKTLDETRRTGDIPDHASVRLIGGLDPAGTGYQAAFLWAVDQHHRKRYAVDFNNQLGGGIQRAREQVKEWFETYGLRNWVIEENLYQGAIVKDEILADYCQQNSITIEPHLTFGNKWDPTLGVSVIATWMDSDLVSIPWGDAESKLKWNAFRKQLINFSRENTRRGKTDIVMASWFPEERIQSWLRNWGLAVDDVHFENAYPFEPLAYSFTALG